jgi:hypothetical protein
MAEMERVQDMIFRVTLVSILFFGAVSPIFRDDALADYVGFASAAILAIYSGYHFTRVRRRPG